MGFGGGPMVVLSFVGALLALVLGAVVLNFGA